MQSIAKLLLIYWKYFKKMTYFIHASSDCASCDLSTFFITDPMDTMAVAKTHLFNGSHQENYTRKCIEIMPEEYKFEYLKVPNIWQNFNSQIWLYKWIYLRQYCQLCTKYQVYLNKTNHKSVECYFSWKHSIFSAQLTSSLVSKLW